MGKLMMLAGGMVEPGKGREATVSAYVVLSAGRMSRIFKLKGPKSAPTITELPAATTLDLRRFQGELHNDLEPEMEALRMRAEPAQLTQPSDAWVCGLVREHLLKTEGIDVE